VSPLFGHKHDDDEAEAAAPSSALTDEVARLDALPLSALAAEVMSKGFGPGAPGADAGNTVTIGGPNINSGVTVGAIATEFEPPGSGRQVNDPDLLQLQRVVAEGIQALEHAGLIRTQMHTSMGSLDYALTRLGRTALERGQVERVLSGETV
jgi:hypothetical protein